MCCVMLHLQNNAHAHAHAHAHLHLHLHFDVNFALFYVQLSFVMAPPTMSPTLNVAALYFYQLSFSARNVSLG